MARHDADIAADVGDDGADGSVAHLGGDLLGSGQSGEKGVCRAGGPGGGSGGPRLAAGRRPSGRGFGVQPWSVADNPGFERLGTQQAASDAG